MNDLDKLRVMLPHWINHNQGHGEEFAQWMKKLETETPEIATLLDRAVHSLQEAQSALEEALHKAGGPLTDQSTGHTHDNGHHHHHS